MVEVNATLVCRCVEEVELLKGCGILSVFMMRILTLSKYHAVITRLVTLSEEITHTRWTMMFVSYESIQLLIL